MTDNRPEPRRNCSCGVTTVSHKTGDLEPRFCVLCGYCLANAKVHVTKRPAVTAWTARTGGDRTISAIGALSLCSLLRRKTG